MSETEPKKAGRRRKDEEPQKREPDKMYRDAVYMSGDLLDSMGEQAEAEDSSRSRLNTEIMSLVLLSPEGRKLRKLALQRNTSLLIELSRVMNLMLSSNLSETVERELERVAKSQFQTPDQIIAELISTVLASRVSDKLVTLAQKNRRTLTQELERNLVLFKEQINFEEITQLAEATQRTPDEMITRLALIGLEVYKQRNLANTD